MDSSEQETQQKSSPDQTQDHLKVEDNTEIDQVPLSKSPYDNAELGGENGEHNDEFVMNEVVTDEKDGENSEETKKQNGHQGSNGKEENKEQANLDDDKKDKKALNWKQYLKDEKVSLDSLKFEKHRGAFVMDDKVIKKDLHRTRPDDPFFQNPNILKALNDIACFYCNSQNVAYQQGLLDVRVEENKIEMIIPFLRLRSPKFRTRDCYAYFASFMRNYFPNILIPTVVHEIKELPHLNAVINHCTLLLDYHATKVSTILRKRNMDLRNFVTPWVMTLFTKGTDLKLVYEIFDHYMSKKDKLFIFYMVTALVIQNQDQIIQLHEENDDVAFILYLNRKMKDESITNKEDIADLFERAEVIKKYTPASFKITLRDLGIMNVEILSIQEFNQFLNHQSEQMLELYPFEIVDYLNQTVLLSQSEKNDNFYDKDINFKIIDCRLKRSDQFPLTIDLSESAFKTLDTLKAALEPICQEEKDTHFCILRNVDKKKEQLNKNYDLALEALRCLGKNYVSIIAGGFEAVQKEMENRQINIPMQPVKKSSIFSKIKGIFSSK